MIQLNSVRLQRGTKVLLENASATLHAGQKCGLIGANGAGKTSLFKLLLGELHEDEGQCQLPNHWTLAHMAQEIQETTSTALDYIIGGDTELVRIQQAINDNQENGETLSKLYETLEKIDGYSAESRAHRLLNGLGFKNDAANKSVSDFSGGWRIRLNLARTLMSRSDVLLLDEPTNHLDLDATLWLEQWLKNYQGSMIIISHDRDFLDNVVAQIFSLENRQIITYSGNYSDYEQQKAARLAQQAAAHQKQQQRISEIEDFVRRFRAKATKAKQAQSRLKELERMEKIAPAHIDSPFNFTIPVADKIPDSLLTITHGEIGYSHSPIAKKIELNILSSSRIGLLGRNGAGKSTLIKTLAGDLPLIAGKPTEALHLKLGYFAQHQLEALDLKASAALHIQRLTPSATEQEVRNYLGGFGFQGDRAFETITHFSGGEKARLALSLICWQKPNLLLLDEPTNHLDLEMRQALTLALQNFSGAVVIVSHDRHLLKNSVDQFILVDEGCVSDFDGTLEDYKQWTTTAALTDSPQTDTPSKKADKKEQRQAAAANREKLKPITNKIKKIETSLQKQQNELRNVETSLADPLIYNNPGEELTHLIKLQASIKSDIENLEEEWILLNEELETIKNI